MSASSIYFGKYESDNFHEKIPGNFQMFVGEFADTITVIFRFRFKRYFAGRRQDRWRCLKIISRTPIIYRARKLQTSYIFNVEFRNLFTVFEYITFFFGGAQIRDEDEQSQISDP